METSFDELIERMAKAMQSMSGEELAALYNREFGNNMEYIGNDMFRQTEV